MKFFENFLIAFEAILVNKVRSLLTMLGVIIGVASVILLVSIGQGVAEEVTGQIQDLGANLLNIIPGRVELEAGGARQHGRMITPKFTVEHVNELKKEPELVAVSPVSEVPAKATFKNKELNTTVMAVSPDYPEARNFHPSEGAFLNSSHYLSARNVCVIGRQAKKELFGWVNPIGKKININSQPFMVIGIMEEKGSFFGYEMDNLIFVPFTAAQKSLDVERASYILAKVNSPSNLELAKQKINRTLRRFLEPDDFSIVSQSEILSLFGSILGTLTLMLGGIAGISLLVGGIGIMNIMLVSVTERTREIGIRKAVGAKTSDILFQFLIESVTLSLAGGALGICFGYLGSLLIKRFLVNTQVTLWSVFLAFVFSSAVGVFFGVYPAYKAAKVDPIVALRYE